MKALKQFLKSYLFIPVSIVVFLFFIAVTGVNKIIGHNTLTNNSMLVSFFSPNPPIVESILENALSPSQENPQNKQARQASVPITITGSLRPGDSLSASFRKNNISETVTNDFFTSLDGILNFKHLKPGDRYTITLGTDGRLAQAVYEASPLEIYTLTRTSNGLKAAQPDVTVERRTVLLDGTITSSLFSAFTDQDVDARLVYAFADIFASKIDFNTETRVGDTFDVLVESYYKNGAFLGYGKILHAKYWQSEENQTLEGYYYAQEGKNGSYFDPAGQELGTSFIKSPVPVGRVTSTFTHRRKHPILDRIRPHLGVDLAAPTGTPIMAASDGVVQSIGRNGGFGNQIVLNHGGDYQTYYGHLSGFKRGLAKGSRVRQKEIIGYVGSTGLSTGPHLDFRVQYRGTFMNPFAMKFKPKSVLQGVALAGLRQEVAETRTLMASALDKGKIVRVTNVVMNAKNRKSILL